MNYWARRRPQECWAVLLRWHSGLQRVWLFPHTEERKPVFLYTPHLASLYVWSLAWHEAISHGVTLFTETAAVDSCVDMVHMCVLNLHYLDAHLWRSSYLQLSIHREHSFLKPYINHHESNKQTQWWDKLTALHEACLLPGWVKWHICNLFVQHNTAGGRTKQIYIFLGSRLWQTVGVM